MGKDSRSCVFHGCAGSIEHFQWEDGRLLVAICCHAEPTRPAYAGPHSTCPFCGHHPGPVAIVFLCSFCRWVTWGSEVSDFPKVTWWEKRDMILMLVSSPCSLTTCHSHPFNHEATPFPAPLSSQNMLVQHCTLPSQTAPWSICHLPGLARAQGLGHVLSVQEWVSRNAPWLIARALQQRKGYK